ncbi:hypothetical protein BD779DRAFT_1496964 [Infundibulicybe gibba]|nr:hypothetical protein BD779DRAFT_1496964 [Infundibulicybe gibba]
MNLTSELSSNQKAAYLRTLPSIRERCGRVFELAKEGKLEYFDYHPEKESDVAAYCGKAMRRDYGTNFSEIKPHSRWRHLDTGVGRVIPVIAKWSAIDQPNAKEEARRTIDLFVVSVLLDAGAGSAWSYTEKSSGMNFSRSEGLAVASIHMFEGGFFSSDERQKYRVDAEGLSKVTPERVAEAMQVTESNPMVAVEGRTSLLFNLSKALKANPEFFGAEGRPGNIIDFLEPHTQIDGDKKVVSISVLWHCLIEGLNSIWPSRHSLGGVALGDVWPCTALKPTSTAEGDEFVPFHKLTMWLTYSLVEVFQRVAKWRVDGLDDMTGLPEYRNGGLFVDLGVLSLKPGVLPIDERSGLPHAAPSHAAVAEWRAMTVILLDRAADGIRKELGLTTAELSLAQILEGATWKCGREIAKEKRPETGGSPIEIDSDGTVF